LRTKRLPSLDSLRVFEAAARHLSLTKASAELHVTQSAVSHRIQALETELKRKLFRRYTRRLELTPAGALLAKGLARGIAEITQAVLALDAPATKTITASVLPSFASRWLVPRLSRFRQRHPEIEVRITAEEQVTDLRDGRADAAVRFGQGRYADMHVTRLMGDTIFPVCSPQFLEEHGPVKTPQDLARLTILHDEVAEADNSGSGWKSWLRHFGIGDIVLDEGPRFNQAVLTLEAAVSGMGIAMARKSLIAGDFEAGRLVRVLPLESPTVYAYYFVCLPDNAARAPLTAFCDWLVEEADQSTAGEIRQAG
jgi:LysR family transcriptional regulator, glycine cleavage system transcriptional activator